MFIEDGVHAALLRRLLRYILPCEQNTQGEREKGRLLSSLSRDQGELVWIIVSQLNLSNQLHNLNFLSARPEPVEGSQSGVVIKSLRAVRKEHNQGMHYAIN